MWVKSETSALIEIFQEIFFFDFFRNFLPKVTSNFLKTTVYWKLAKKASFWHISWLLFMKVEIWPFIIIFGIGRTVLNNLETKFSDTWMCQLKDIPVIFEDIFADVLGYIKNGTRKKIALFDHLHLWFPPPKPAE